MLTEYCVLPLGSREIREYMQSNIRSIMFYGPSGSGKSLAISAIANEVNGIIFDLSPVRLRGKFEGKSAQTKLIHMVFMVAKEVSNSPSIIFLDNCDDFMLNGKNKKKAGKCSAVRFMKDLQIYRNQALSKHDNVLIIGATNQTDRIDIKQCRKFFDKFIYFPHPDYADRMLLWKHFLTKHILDLKVDLDSDFQKWIDFSTLSKLSEGFTAGSIEKSVTSTLEFYFPQSRNESKTQTLLEDRSNEFKAYEDNNIVHKLLQCLGTCACEEEAARFSDFTFQITNLKEMKQHVQNNNQSTVQR